MMRLAALAMTMFLQTAQPPLDNTTLLVSNPAPDLADVYMGDTTEIKITQPNVGADGGKTYTVVTGKDWTCTPTTLTKSSATLVCVKSDSGDGKGKPSGALAQ